MICAIENNKDSCYGDSGSPLVVKSTSEQVGIVSWGISCGDPEYPGVYSNVVLVRDWIEENTGIKLKDQCSKHK